MNSLIDMKAKSAKQFEVFKVSSSLFRLPVLKILVLIFLSLYGCTRQEKTACQIIGTLRVSTDNPRYFADSTGKIVYLTGSHTWTNLVDAGPGYPPGRFDFDKYLDWLEAYNHNFIRLWTWDMLTWHSGNYNPDNILSIYPHPYARTGPGEATDGKPKFDLFRFDDEYFARLRERIEKAGKRGIYVSVMLFEGWSMQFATDGWKNHFFNPMNNINGVNGDINNDGVGLEIYTLADSTITGLQERYTKHVIDVVNEFDNVLFEISNENHPPSTEWQYHLIDFIHKYEMQKSKQHPVGMTFQYRGGSNETLFLSPAEWISPNSIVENKDVRNNPPAATGKKVILYDTDHIGGIWGNQPWVWKTFLRGMNPLFMDTYNGIFIPNPPETDWDPVRRSMGYTRDYANRVNLVMTIPHDELSSTGFCLAYPGKVYIVYQEVPDSAFKVTTQKGRYYYEWFNPMAGTVFNSGKIKLRDGLMDFKAPFYGDAVLYLKRISPFF